MTVSPARAEGSVAVTVARLPLPLSLIDARERTSVALDRLSSTRVRVGSGVAAVRATFATTIAPVPVALTVIVSLASSTFVAPSAVGVSVNVPVALLLPKGMAMVKSGTAVKSTMSPPPPLPLTDTVTVEPSPAAPAQAVPASTVAFTVMVCGPPSSWIGSVGDSSSVTVPVNLLPFRSKRF